MKIESAIAAVTGAASGMGRALAIQLAVEGAAGLALCDVNMKELEETAALAKRAAKVKNLKVTCSKVDVSNSANVEAWRDEVVREHGSVQMLFNNAGINAIGRMVHAKGTSAAEVAHLERLWDRCFAIDFFGVLYCCRAFLPELIKSKEAHLINTASVNAFWTWPEHSSYTAAKHAVKGLSDSLHIELQMKAPHVKVTCLFPGGVKTNIAKDTLHLNEQGMSKVAEVFESEVDLSAEEAADWILGAVKQNQYRALIGYDAILLDKMVRVGPQMVYSFYEALGRIGMNADMAAHEQNQQALSVLNAVRFVTSGGWFTLLFVWPVPLLRLRKTLTGRAVLASMAAATAVGMGKLSSKL
jgi:NAD(P)-dependent dehydrogenase (short-subunit alcohol dehydrogenase family)